MFNRRNKGRLRPLVAIVATIIVAIDMLALPIAVSAVNLIVLALIIRFGTMLLERECNLKTYGTHLFEVKYGISIITSILVLAILFYTLRFLLTPEISKSLMGLSAVSLLLSCGILFHLYDMEERIDKTMNPKIKPKKDLPK